jgi:hypothetical protein
MQCIGVVRFVISAIPLTRILLSTLPQTTGNALINCINAAHEKYESNAMEWQRVIEMGWGLLSRVDMESFEQMCKDGLFGAKGLWSL